IVGSPFGTNVFRLAGPNVGGPGVDVVETNLFTMVGKIFVRPPTTTSLGAGPNPSVTGQPVTLTATVSQVTPAPEIIAGTVTFMDGSTSLGDVTIASGSASLTTSALSVGTHSLSAIYSGNPDFVGSTSAVVAQAVNQGATSTSISSTPNPATIGQTGTISVTVSPVAPAAGVPAGTVTIMDGVTSLGVVTLVNGSASLATSALTAGTHSLTAAYGGSPSFLASTSAAVTQTVNVLTTTTVASTP